MSGRARRTAFLAVLVLTVGVAAWFVVRPSNGVPASVTAEAPIAVETAFVRRGPMELRRSLSGTLAPVAQFVVAPKVAGQLRRMEVDLGDRVRRGQVVAELDDDEYVQAVAQATASRDVAKAELAAARQQLEIARRGFERTRLLVSERLANAVALDEADAERARGRAAVDVAASQLQRAEAALREARVRASYARIRADWPGEDEERVVAARYADEGEMVAANAPLLSIVDLDPVQVIVHVTEQDYPNLVMGTRVLLSARAYPGEVFEAEVERVSPVFVEESRQARVELSAQNPDGRLKPGMFVHVDVLIERHEDAVAVPREALIERGGQPSLFVVSEDGKRVALRQVTTGIEQAGWVQIVDAESLTGQVVTLGQQQLEPGAPIVVRSHYQGDTGRDHEWVPHAETPPVVSERP